MDLNCLPPCTEIIYQKQNILFSSSAKLVIVVEGMMLLFLDIMILRRLVVIVICFSLCGFFLRNLWLVLLLTFFALHPRGLSRLCSPLLRVDIGHTPRITVHLRFSLTTSFYRSHAVSQRVSERQENKTVGVWVHACLRFDLLSVCNNPFLPFSLLDSSSWSSRPLPREEE